jgi:hypothetical protein
MRHKKRRTYKRFVHIRRDVLNCPDVLKRRTALHRLRGACSQFSAVPPDVLMFVKWYAGSGHQDIQDVFLIYRTNFFPPQNVGRIESKPPNLFINIAQDVQVCPKTMGHESSVNRIQDVKHIGFLPICKAEKPPTLCHQDITSSSWFTYVCVKRRGDSGRQTSRCVGEM